jgi:murein DD-endopeptidase MepM/ murein hydrolase activator NlpD
LERPIAAPGTVTIDPTYPYGSTQQGARQPHHGVEFYNVSGTPVLAAADGIVFVAGNDRQANTFSPWLNFYGNLVVLQHQLPGVNGPVYSLYGHLSKINVSIKQRVHAGEEIGEVGATGAATGSHLHFEVRLGRDDYESNRNPVLWLKPLMNKDGKPFGAIAGRLVDGKGKPLQYTGINIQYFPSPGGAQTAAYQVDTYAPEEHPVRSDDAWLENFTLGDLPAGQYRISIIWSGVLYERWIEVQEGKVTVVAFIIK